MGKRARAFSLASHNVQVLRPRWVIPRGMVPRISHTEWVPHSMVSHETSYPTRRGIPQDVVSRTTSYPARRRIPLDVVSHSCDMGRAGVRQRWHSDFRGEHAVCAGALHSGPLQRITSLCKADAFDAL